RLYNSIIQKNKSVLKIRNEQFPNFKDALILLKAIKFYAFSSSPYFKRHVSQFCNNHHINLRLPTTPIRTTSLQAAPLPTISIQTTFGTVQTNPLKTMHKGLSLSIVTAESKEQNQLIDVRQRGLIKQEK